MHDWPEIREQHGPLVWRTVYRILRDHAEALDCLQDVFAEVIARPPPETILSWPAFLRWLAVRRALDRFRRRRAEASRVVPIDEIAVFCSSARGPHIEVEWNELTERVRNDSAGTSFSAASNWFRCVPFVPTQLWRRSGKRTAASAFGRGSRNQTERGLYSVPAA